MYRQTGPAPDVMVLGGIGLHSRTSPLVRINGRLTIQRVGLQQYYFSIHVCIGLFGGHNLSINLCLGACYFVPILTDLSNSCCM